FIDPLKTTPNVVNGEAPIRESVLAVLDPDKLVIRAVLEPHGGLDKRGLIDRDFHLGVLCAWLANASRGEEGSLEKEPVAQGEGAAHLAPCPLLAELPHFQ